MRCVTIIVLTWNGLEFTRACLDSLFKNTDLSQVELIVVDNGSTDGTVEYLKSLKGIKAVFNLKNLGFVRGNNIAIRLREPASDIVLLNNDTEIHDPLWLEKLKASAYIDEKIGIAGCRIRRTGSDKLQHAGTYMPDFTYWGQQIAGNEKDINQYNEDMDVEGVVFACVYIKAVVIDRIGMLDEAYFSYYEDTDYCFKAREAGFRVVLCGSLTILHREHASTAVNRVNRTELFLASQKIFKEKWLSVLEKRLDMNIVWHSTFLKPLGYATHSRLMALSLEDQGIAVAYEYLYGRGTVFPVEENRAASSGNYRIDVIRRRKPKENSLHIIYGQGDAFKYVKEGYRVGFTMLETTGIPEKWVRQCNLVDEVWVPTPFNAWTFRKSGVKKPISIMPLGLIDINYFNPRITGYPMDGTFTFLSIFEWGERKAPEILLKAFNQEFRKDEPVILICKYVNNDSGVNVKELIDSLSLDPDGGRIILSENEQIPYYQLPQLYRSSDCFVLPTRGEGWGMPILEAMACGLPVIASYWSGQQFFMTDANSYPLQVRLTVAKAKCPYYAGFKWAEPDMYHLKSLMRYVFEHPEEAQQKGSRAAEDVRGKWTLELSGKRMRARLEEIERERKEGRKPSFSILSPKDIFNPKIGFDVSRAIGHEVTGIGRYCLNLLKGFASLSEDENPFEFITLPGFGGYVHPEYMRKVFYKGLPDARFTIYRGPLPAFSCADHYVPGLDIVHCTSNMMPEHCDKPMVFTVHDLTFITHAHFHTRENIKLCETNLNRAKDSGCHFCAVSENTKKDLMKIYGIEPDRITVTYNSVCPKEFRKLPEISTHIIREKYNLPDRFFLYVGSLEPRKNLATAIKAMSIYRGKEPLVVIGASGWLNSELHSLLAKSKNRIRLLGFIPQEELPAFYNAALAFVYPSIYEGFGIPIVESMACGTPVITSNNSSLSEIGKEACILLADPANSEELADALVRLAEDNALCADLAAKGLIRAGKFTPENSALTTINVYKRFLPEK